jgi:hypothetical protein
MSAMGQKQTSRHVRVMSALPPITEDEIGAGRRVSLGAAARREAGAP